eukprot:5188011-Pyramimonas_sp.AAC.1
MEKLTFCMPARGWRVLRAGMSRMSRAPRSFCRRNVCFLRACSGYGAPCVPNISEDVLSETLVLQRLKGLGSPGCPGVSGSAVGSLFTRDRGPGTADAA